MKTKELLCFRYYFLIQNELVEISRSFVAHDLLRTIGVRTGQHARGAPLAPWSSWPCMGTRKMPVVPTC